MMKEIIRVENLQRSFGVGDIEVKALKNLNLTVTQGEYVAIMGHSGSGKSTLMNILGCLDRPSSGNYFLDGQDVATESADQLSDIRNRKIGFVFQAFNLIPRTSALKNVELPMIYAKVPVKERQARAKALLEKVGLGQRLYHMPNELSGGQKQRVAIAGIMAMKPDCIVLDEPTAMLDPNGRKEVIRTVRELNRKEGVTVLLITHYMEEVIHADRVIVMDEGKVVLQGTPKEIFSKVEELKRYRLDVPQVTELAYELKKSGLDLPEGILTVEEFLETIQKAVPFKTV